jgi:hypothetical protein
VARTAASGTGPHSARSSSRCAWRCSRFCTRCARRQRVRSGRPRLGSPLPHLHRDLARCCHTCAESGLTPATSAPGLSCRRVTSASGLGAPLPHLHRDCPHPCSPCHVCGHRVAAPPRKPIQTEPRSTPTGYSEYSC